MKNILVTGSKGQLGLALQAVSSRFPDFTLIPAGREDLDISDADAISAYFSSHDFDAVVNCAAYTEVDKAETEEDAAFLLNFQAPLLLAEAALAKGCTFIHLSTDYVFDGSSSRPYTEEAETSPQTIYGASKLRGEAAVLGTNPAAIVLRTSWLYSPNGTNFALRMQELMKEKESLNVVFDQTGTPTYAPDLAVAIFTILSHPAPDGGVYHFSNEGVATWYDFAVAIKELTGAACKLQPVTSEQYPTAAMRPAYSVLNKGKIKAAFGLEIPYWKDSLAVCLGK